MLKILFCSSVCSEQLLSYLMKNTTKPIGGLAGQKFNRLIIEGLDMNRAKVHTISARPITFKNYEKLICKSKKEKVDGIEYNYCSFINLPVIRTISVFINTFIYSWKWSKRYKDGVIISYSLNIAVSLATLLISKLLKNRIVGIVTDIPGKLADSRRGLLAWIIKSINLSYMKSFDYYIVLTEYLNNLFNVRNKPYIIMEGLVDIKMKNLQIEKKNLETESIVVMYAGQLAEIYGLKNMVEGFMATDDKNAKFIIYGTGSFVKDLQQYALIDDRIEYRGVVSNKEVFSQESKATILINVRPTHELYTQYSFPSKNIEYMLSGTPVLTSRMLGIPSEYYDYMYMCETGTKEEVTSKLSELFEKSNNELEVMGQRARDFVLEFKNNKIQAKRIINLVIDY